MTFDEYLQAKDWLYEDIQREIDWARASVDTEKIKTINKLGLPKGGGNHIASLALMMGIEIGGLIRYGNDISCKERFEKFLSNMGNKYKRLVDNFKFGGKSIYDIFRCGLVHEFFVKNSCEYSMLNNKDLEMGMGTDGKLCKINVEKLFHDFQKEFDKLEKEIFIK